MATMRIVSMPLLFASVLGGCTDRASEDLDTSLASAASTFARLTADPVFRDGLRASLGDRRSISLGSIGDLELSDGQSLGAMLVLGQDLEHLTLALGPVEWSGDEPALVGFVPIDSEGATLTFFDARGHATMQPSDEPPMSPALVLVADETLVAPAATEPEPVASATGSYPVYFRELMIRHTHEAVGDPEIFSRCNTVRDDYSWVNDTDMHIINNYLADTTQMTCWIMEDDWGSASYGNWDSGDDMVGQAAFTTDRLVNTNETTCLEISNYDAIMYFSRVRAPNISPYPWMDVRQPCTSIVQ